MSVSGATNSKLGSHFPLLLGLSIKSIWPRSVRSVVKIPPNVHAGSLQIKLRYKSVLTVQAPGVLGVVSVVRFVVSVLAVVSIVWSPHLRSQADSFIVFDFKLQPMRSSVIEIIANLFDHCWMTTLARNGNNNPLFGWSLLWEVNKWLISLVIFDAKTYNSRHKNNDKGK